MSNEEGDDSFTELETATTMDSLPDTLAMMEEAEGEDLGVCTTEPRETNEEPSTTGKGEPSSSRFDDYVREGGGGCVSGRMDDVLNGAIIGTGSGGVVLRCRRKKDGKIVVLKRVEIDRHIRDAATGKFTPSKGQDASSVDVTDREVRALVLLSHPHIVSYIEHFVSNNSLFIAMEYLSRGDLSSHLNDMRQRGEHFSERELFHRFAQVCLAIEYVHSKGIIHRDIKSSNILVAADNTLKVGDFGIATFIGAGSGSGSGSGSGGLGGGQGSKRPGAKTVIGTPFYFAPEMCEMRAEDDASYDTQADMWALGCLLYEMATLDHAFYGNCLVSVIMKIIRGNYDEEKIESIYAPIYVTGEEEDETDAGARVAKQDGAKSNQSSVSRLVSYLLRRDPSERMTARCVCRTAELHPFVRTIGRMSGAFEEAERAASAEVADLRRSREVMGSAIETNTTGLQRSKSCAIASAPTPRRTIAEALDKMHLEPLHERARGDSGGSDCSHPRTSSTGDDEVDADAIVRASQRAVLRSQILSLEELRRGPVICSDGASALSCDGIDKDSPDTETNSIILRRVQSLPVHTLMVPSSRNSPNVTGITDDATVQRMHITSDAFAKLRATGGDLRGDAAGCAQDQTFASDEDHSRRSALIARHSFMHAAASASLGGPEVLDACKEGIMNRMRAHSSSSPRDDDTPRDVSRDDDEHVEYASVEALILEKGGTSLMRMVFALVMMETNAVHVGASAVKTSVAKCVKRLAAPLHM